MPLLFLPFPLNYTYYIGMTRLIGMLLAVTGILVFLLHTLAVLQFLVLRRLPLSSCCRWPSARRAPGPFSSTRSQCFCFAFTLLRLAALRLSASLERAGFLPGRTSALHVLGPPAYVPSRKPRPSADLQRFAASEALPPSTPVNVDVTSACLPDGVLHHPEAIQHGSFRK